MIPRQSDACRQKSLLHRNTIIFFIHFFCLQKIHEHIPVSFFKDNRISKGSFHIIIRRENIQFDFCHLSHPPSPFHHQYNSLSHRKQHPYKYNEKDSPHMQGVFLIAGGQRRPIMPRASRSHSRDVFAYDLFPNQLRPSGLLLGQVSIRTGTRGEPSPS